MQVLKVLLHSDQCNVSINTLSQEQKDNINIDYPSESNLAFQISIFYDYVLNTLDDLHACHTCDYFHSICNDVSEFVTQCKVLGDDNTESVLLLCRLTAIVMRKCFDLLGIDFFEYLMPYKCCVYDEL